jgi:CHASE3 domain sensor protein
MRSLDRPFPIRWIAVVGLSISLLFTLLVAWSQWQTVNGMLNTRDWVRHTRTVQFALEYFRYCISTAESNQRGYLLTHQEVYLDSYRKSLALDSDQFTLLRQLTADDPDQQKNLDRLEGFLNEKFRVMAQTISLEQSGDHAGALDVVNNGNGDKSMEGIIATVQTMQDEETNFVQQHQDIYKSKFDFNNRLSSVLLIFCLGFIITILVLARRIQTLQGIIIDNQYQTEGERMLQSLGKNNPHTTV